MMTLGNLGEHEAIARLSAMLGTPGDVLVGVGDDCAVCALSGTGNNQLFTTDPVVEGVHFLPSDDPVRVGNKAVGRVLSDIAAMGGCPQWILVNVVAPPEVEFGRIERIYEGMIALCNRFGATIIGGDLAKGASLELHLFGTGLVPAGNALLRSGARVGDAVFVTGSLGGSLAGKHLDFVPRVDEGVFLRETGVVHAMMDISDGLATDLRHILAQSGVGASLQGESIPSNGSLEQAIYDGEDFELLLTVAEGDSDLLQARWRARFETPLSKVGAITGETGVLRLDGQVLKSKAYEHYRRP
ncbi:thiamine-phosphate kinase [Pontiella sp.]|uniref:thiamine-phosphate kinase n=1 Tax=Pontiella sp. TaxID=2837462 RepID=UPI00356B5A8E